MATVWKVYYDHWAKENNQEKQRNALFQGLFKTICKLTEGLSEAPIPEGKDFSEIQRNLLEDLEPLLFMDCFSPEEKIIQMMSFLGDIGEWLHPSHLPRKKEEDLYLVSLFGLAEGIRLERSLFTPWFRVPPLEARLAKNLGYTEKFALSGHQLGAKEVHRLDAILALM